MEWYENKFLEVGDLPGMNIDDFNTIIIHADDPLCIIRVVREDKRGPAWQYPAFAKDYWQKTPAGELLGEEDFTEKFTLWIFRPAHFSPEEWPKYEAILDGAWRFYIGD